MSDLFKKEKKIIEDSAYKLLEFAQKSGADSAEVCASYGQSAKITMEKQEYHMASSDSGFQFGIRVMRGNRQGFSSCNTVDPTELKEVALRAVEIAGFSPENPNYGIFPGSNVPSQAPKLNLNETLMGLSLQTQKDYIKLLYNESLKDPRIKINEGSVENSSTLFLVSNTLGVHQIETDCAFSWGLMGMAIEGETITSFDYFGEMTREVTAIGEKMVSSTGKFKNDLIRCLKQGKAQSYKGLVLFTPRAVLDILISTLAYHFNGRTLAEKTSRWTLNDLDKKVVNEAITIRDLPWLKDRRGFATFDREGTPTQNLSPIENGVLKHFLFDHYAAKATGQTTTGHAFGSPSSLPTVSTHCLTVEKGTEPLKDLFHKTSTQKPGLLVVHRYSGQADPVTGDFSGVAKGAEWWVDGSFAFSPKETLISGNVYEALGHGLIGISQETEVIDSGEEAPSFLIDQISVTAG